MARILVQERFDRSGDLTGSGNPIAGLGYLRGPATHSGFGGRIPRWVSDGDKLAPTQERTPGVAATNGTAGHDLTGNTFTPQVAATLLPLYATSGGSIYGGDVPTEFEIEVSMTITIPPEWPANGVNPLADYFAVGFMFFVPVAVLFNDWDPAYQLYFLRTPINDQELRGEFMLNAWTQVNPDTVGLQVTGQSGRFHVFGAANSLDLRGNTTAMQLKAVFHNMPSGNTQIFGMRMYVDQTLVYAHSFNRFFLQQLGFISAGEPAIEALRRRVGWFAYVNGDTQTEDVTGYGSIPALAKEYWPRIDSFIVRDLLADAEPPIFPEPTLSGAGAKPTTTLSGTEGTASEVLTIQPSDAEEVAHSIPVAEHPYETGHEATFPVGQKNRRQWSMRWLVLTSSERSTLRTFVTTLYGQGGAFTWVHPTTGEQIKAHFLTDVTFTQIGPAQYSAEAPVEELF